MREISLQCQARSLDEQAKDVKNWRIKQTRITEKSDGYGNALIAKII
tara:strand:+ start:197 stop:337 length:141 start_codon:yes stop_codon:yes gene_type:complete